MKKRPHFYYTVDADSPTGHRLQDFMTRCAVAEEQARQWVAKQGANEYVESISGMAGGVGAVLFADEDCAKGWEGITAADGTVYYLPEPNSELEREMYALPTVSEMELISILSFKHRFSKGGTMLPFTFGDETPIVFLHGNIWYADVPYECEANGCCRVGEKDFEKHRLKAAQKAERTQE